MASLRRVAILTAQLCSVEEEEEEQDEPGRMTGPSIWSENATLGGGGTLKGKTLMITGASRGIGLCIAKRAARDGANVVICAKTIEAHPTLPGSIHEAVTEVHCSYCYSAPLPGLEGQSSLCGRTGRTPRWQRSGMRCRRARRGFHRGSCQRGGGQVRRHRYPDQLCIRYIPNRN